MMFNGFKYFLIRKIVLENLNETFFVLELNETIFETLRFKSNILKV